MSDKSALQNILQTQNAEAIAAAKENHEKLIEGLGNIAKQNHSYFVTLGALIANQITAGNNPHNLDDMSFPNFINRAITLQLNSSDHMLDECLQVFNINNSAIIQSMLKASKE